ncbi:hypothetical protein HHK36_003835 [Tetracentron sinense]|uniref:Uncharacterized protein n=1 Tax=Tetracentron sinense TaxID=13715 RepID=A0A835DPE8_TETSI|nr:hypothetical protein HHK36_003835 [Tetracentron sinense]
MAFLVLPNLSPSLLLQTKSKEKLIHQTFHPKPTLISSSLLTNLETPHTLSAAQDKKKNDFYVNLGIAVRTLREDLPLLFSQHLNYDIYRDDIAFKDPMNTFMGIESYKMIFWALRFHGRILFREISLEICRVWQPSEKVIVIRWNLKGVVRVPWEAKGQFQGNSRYKLDRNGKIYEHRVDSLAFNLGRAPLRQAGSVLDLVPACPASPSPTFYRAAWETLDRSGFFLGQESLVTPLRLASSS